MSNDKALAISPKSLSEVQTIADVFSKSALLPDALRGKTPDIVVSIMAGAELGLSPMAAIRGVYVVQGKPVLSADTMVGLVLGSGLCEYFVQVEASASSVTYETKRKGSPVAQKCTWTIEDAKRASLHLKDTWRAHPRQMLSARAKSELARSAYPDVLAGCYDPDEIAVPVVVSAPPPPAKHADVVDAEIVNETIDVPELTALGEPSTLDELQAAVPKLAHLTGAAKKAARAWYSEQLKRLETLVPLTEEEARQRKTTVVRASDTADGGNAA